MDKETNELIETKADEEKEILVVDEKSLKDMIYEIRGQKVMLDSDLARIYGYSTRTFNQQVIRNISKFPIDFRFQLTKSELNNLARSQFVTSRTWTVGNTGGRAYLPYAFTEKGIYMLMTVLKGELAIKQSIALIRLFDSMKKYIAESNQGQFLLETTPYLENRLNKIEKKQTNQDKRFRKIEGELDIIMTNFNDPTKLKEFVIKDGERIEADLAYREIYSLAKHSIIIIDDYISLKTLEHLKVCPNTISITICSDNVSKEKLTETQLSDFKLDTGMKINLIPTNNRFHDRYIVIDYKEEGESIYLSGPSSKDAGNRIATIMKSETPKIYHVLIDELIMKN